MYPIHIIYISVREVPYRDRASPMMAAEEEEYRRICAFFTHHRAVSARTREPEEKIRGPLLLQKRSPNVFKAE